MFLMLFTAGASAQVYHYNAGNITDSAGILTFKKPVRMMNLNQDFGYGSTLWNFRLENDEGTIVWRANNDRDLLTYDDDGHIWDLTGTLKINGVTISSGGGDAYLTNRQTFTKRNIFSDTLKADALSLMEQVRIADWFQVTGDVISNFMFIKGSRTFTGTADNYGFVIKTADTNRIEIDSLGYVTINKRLSVGEYVIATDSVISNTLSTGDMFLNNNGSGIYWRGYSSYINEGVNELFYSSKTHNFSTKNGNNYIAILDSASGMNLLYGSYTGSGTGLTNVDAVTLKGQDTTHFARTDTLTTENIKGAWTFWNVVRCIGIVTFDVSPVFNSVVNFANGITTTTLTVSSTATFNGDMINTGWKSVGSAQNQYKYLRDTVLKMVLSGSSGTAITDSVTHGISNWRSIVFTQFIVHEDSADVNSILGLYSNESAAAGMFGGICWTDSRCARVRLTGGNGSSTNLRGDTCTVYIKYTDYNR